MTLDDLETLVGHWVQIRTAGGFGGFIGASGVDVGVLQEVEEGHLLLKRPDGEVAFLPLANIRHVMPLDEPSTPATTLLRSSEAPEEPLLRPASKGSSDDPDKLLRPG
jgi:hypothetical protein